MRVTVFGAGGRTGRLVVAEAIRRGHEVTAVVRRPPDPPLDPAARIVVGDAREAASVAPAIEDAQAVLSAMGPAGDDPGTAYSDSVRSLVRVLGDRGPRRIVITANARVFDDQPLSGRYAGVSEEHRRALATLRDSGLRWTVVASPMLADGPAEGMFEVVVDGRGGGEDVDRPDFARAMVDALDRDDWVGHAIDVTR